jgi:uncharacterized repeat protein (TIGR01451 family)
LIFLLNPMTSLRTFFRLLAGALLLSGGAALPAQAQHAAMLQQIVHPAVPSVGNIRTATDAAGNTYYVGCWSRSVSIDGTVLTAAPTDLSVNLYVAKIAPTGRLQWVQNIHSDSTDIPYAIAVDPTGTAVYVSGTNNKNLRLGTTHTLDSAGTFMARMNTATGAVDWARMVGTRDFSVPSLAKEVLVYTLVATNAGVYFSGIARNTDSLGAVTLLNARLAPVGFVARCLPATGRITAAWNCAASTFLPTQLNMGALAVQDNGEVVVVGGLNGSAQLGADGTPTLLTSAASTPANSLDGFIAHITLSATGGSTQWVLPHVAAPSALQIDAQHNVYMGGRADGTAAIGPFPLPPTGLFFACLNPLGVPQWLRPVAATFPQVMSMATGPDGRMYAVGTFSDPEIQFGPHSVQNGLNQNLASFVTCFDPNGIFQWARGTDRPDFGANLVQSIGVDAESRVFVGGFAGYADSYDGLPFGAVTSYLVRFDPGARISGQVYLDQNANGVRDAGEPPFPRHVTIIDPQNPALIGIASPSNGRFVIYADTGQYTVKVAQAPLHYTLGQAATGYTGHLTQYGQADTARVFGLKPIPGATDLRVTVTSYTPARVGRATYYQARVENVGAMPVSAANLVLTYESQYVGASPTPTTHVGQELTWALPTIAPFQVLNFTIATNLPINIPIGNPITTLAALTNVPADLVLRDNRDTLRQIVVGSADPNDIQVNYSRLTPQQVANGTTLDYTIRFQNIGTDTAFAVMIQDSLPASLLRLGTVEMVAQSHNCQWRLDGQGHMSLSFPGIKLPHRNVNAVGSMGFVRFRVVPLPTLAPGDLIPNQAHITFDYNAPISTNEVTTLVQNPNGLVAEPGAAASWSLYPNPATTEDVTLTANVLTAGRVQVLVTDALGRPVQQETATVTAGPWSHAVSAQGLAPGLYLVRLTLPGGGSTSRKLVVR